MAQNFSPETRDLLHKAEGILSKTRRSNSMRSPAPQSVRFDTAQSSPYYVAKPRMAGGGMTRDDFLALARDRSARATHRQQSYPDNQTLARGDLQSPVSKLSTTSEYAGSRAAMSPETVAIMQKAERILSRSQRRTQLGTSAGSSRYGGARAPHEAPRANMPAFSSLKYFHHKTFPEITREVAARRIRAPEVLLLGEASLRERSIAVDDIKDATFQEELLTLHGALENFRSKHGFGRAISAPQIGINKRFIAMNLGKGPLTLINPEITWRSRQTFTMWDDCMSMPWIMVKVSRAKSVSVTFTDDAGDVQEWREVDESLAELLQHEIDHLNGVLMVNTAVDPFTGIIAREVYERRKDEFNAQVDYSIQPTI